MWLNFGLSNWLKIGLQSRYGPNFVVEFEAFFRKKLAWPSVRIYKRFIEVQLTISFIEQRVGVQNPSQAIYQIDAFL